MNELVHNKLAQHQALDQLPEVEAQLQQHCALVNRLSSDTAANQSSPECNKPCKQGIN